MAGWRHHYDKASTSLTASVHALIDLDNGWLEHILSMAGGRLLLHCKSVACNGEMTTVGNERHNI